MDFNFDLAEPLQTSTTRHQRNFSQSLLSNIKFEPRTAEQREADARRNAPKYAREKAVNSMLTARFLKAKKAFDAYWRYDIDAAWDGDAGVWRDERDPWLRIPASGSASEGPVGEFLRGYTRAREEAASAGTDKKGNKDEAGEAAAGDAGEGQEEVSPQQPRLSADELEALALALVRVARVDLKAAGRDNKVVDAEFKKGVLEVVAQLTSVHGLPQSAPEDDDDEEEEEDDS